MRDKHRGMGEADLSVWRGIFFGILLGATMWAGILWVLWLLWF